MSVFFITRPLCTKWTEIAAEAKGLTGLKELKRRTNAGNNGTKKQTNDEGMEERLHFRAKMLQSAVGRPGAANVRAKHSGMDVQLRLLHEIIDASSSKWPAFTCK